MYSGIAKECKESKLYKYYSCNECMCEMFAPLQKATLRYTSPFAFNDPYDCYVARINDAKIKPLYYSIMKDVKVCSLTTTCDNMLMWSHYGSSHTGFVLEYDVEKLKKLHNHQMETFSYVEYSDEIIARNMIKELCSCSSIKNEEGEKRVVQAIFHKPLCWQYENEVRSVVYGEENDKTFTDIKLLDDSISSVILGSHFISRHKGISMDILKDWAKQGKLFYMQLLSDKYKLEKKLLDLESFNNLYQI